MTTPEPCRSLYVHVPFCRSLCGYCDFYSEVLDPRAARPLVDALLAELDSYARRRPLAWDTIFVGGGTPTVLPVPDLSHLLAGIRRFAGPDGDLEFSVEANPATVSPAVAEALAVAGVNRVSVGAQSFDPGELRVLDRTHTPEQVADTVAILRAAGLRRLSLDLIFGIPGQTLASWLRSLQAALSLSPEHLSCYGLTYEPGTPLCAARDAGRVIPVEEDVEAEMYIAAMNTLAAAGLHQYELSNYARPGAECRHNLRYWRNEPYLGIGPAAAGYLDGVRYKNVADTAAYVQAIVAGRSPRGEAETLPRERKMGETAMLNLRTAEGIDRSRFLSRFGSDPAIVFARAIERHTAAGLLEADGCGIRLTRAGRLVADRVMADFV
ncbi:MAG: radical SAM family heme chaperone HemW [Planctomycetota bacterium]